MKGVLDLSIKSAMDRAGITQAQLARDMNVNPSAVNGWIAGRFSPNAKRLSELSEKLHCTVDELLKENGKEEA